MILKIPPRLKPGDTIGICTPSFPGYTISEEVFAVGIKNIEAHGYVVKQGFVTAKRMQQGYRSASPQERARELMELFLDTEVKGIITTIGGMNSSSIVQFLDFEMIKGNPKVFCGYSDITSLHLALMNFAGLATYYGPGVMGHWSDWPSGISESLKSFFDALKNERRILKPFSRWSNHSRDWKTDDWKILPREWKENYGWKILNQGYAKAPVVVCNLNTLSGVCGTDLFPNLDGKILVLEEMSAPLSKEERSLVQLKMMGVFDKILGLLIGKPEFYNQEDADFGLNELILEVVGTRNYPIISDFDCSHTIPMHTIRQGSLMEINAQGGYLSEIVLN